MGGKIQHKSQILQFRISALTGRPGFPGYPLIPFGPGGPYEKDSDTAKVSRIILHGVIFSALISCVTVFLYCLTQLYCKLTSENT